MDPFSYFFLFFFFSCHFWSDAVRKAKIVLSSPPSTPPFRRSGRRTAKDRTRSRAWGSDTIAFDFWVQIEIDLAMFLFSCGFLQDFCTFSCWPTHQSSGCATVAVYVIHKILIYKCCVCLHEWIHSYVPRSDDAALPTLLCISVVQILIY